MSSSLSRALGNVSRGKAVSKTLCAKLSSQVFTEAGTQTADGTTAPSTRAVEVDETSRSYDTLSGRADQAVPGCLNDVERLGLTQRARWTISISSEFRQKDTLALPEPASRYSPSSPFLRSIHTSAGSEPSLPFSRSSALRHVSSCTASLLPLLHQQHRGMFIQTQSTPNPTSLKFLPGSPVLPGDTAEYSSARAALASPLAIALFRIDGVSRVFLGADFITVTKDDSTSWDVLRPEVFAAIMDFYSSGKPVIDPTAKDASAESGEQDSEVVEMIKELLETRIRPAVQEDGGDIDFHSFDEETGVVTLRMRGACSGCPSSSVTLKSGVESMLMHYIPEVTSVEQLMEDEEASSENSNLGSI